MQDHIEFKIENEISILSKQFSYFEFNINFYVDPDILFAFIIVIVIVIAIVSVHMPWVAMGSRPINCS